MSRDQPEVTELWFSVVRWWMASAPTLGYVEVAR